MSGQVINIVRGAARKLHKADRDELLQIHDQYKKMGREMIRRAVVEHNRVDILATEILGYEVQPFHLAMMRFQFLHPHSLQLAFRGCGKTVSCTVTKAIHLLIKNRNLRILLASKSKSNAEGFLKEIRTHFEQNTRLIETFGEFYDPAKVSKWDNTEIEVVGRDRVIRESSITCVSVESAVVSRHFDCIAEGSLVYTSKGLVPIETIGVGTRVLNKDGMYTNVIATKSRSATELVSIDVAAQPEPVRCTPEHPVLCWRGDSIRWLEAQAIEAGDHTVLPVSSNGTGATRLGRAAGTRVNQLLRNRNVWRLIGYWLGDGCATPGDRVRISFGAAENEIIDDARRIVEEVLEVPFRGSYTKSSTFLAAFVDLDFKSILNRFGSHSYNKIIPAFAVQAARQHQAQLIRGYFRCDGCLGEGRWTANSTSRSLAAGIHQVLVGLSVPATVGFERPAGKMVIVGNECATRDLYVVGSSHPTMHAIMGTRAAWNPQPASGFAVPGAYMTRVRSVSRECGDFTVHDIQVKDGESFVVPGACVHNCIISDDLVDEDNARTKHMRDKVRTWYYQTLDPTLMPPDPDVPHVGEHHILGTRYHFDDLYGHLMSNELNQHHQVIPALDEKGRSPWPEKYPPVWLQEKKVKSGTIIFNCQYQNDTEAMKGEIFQYDQCLQVPADDYPKDLKVYAGVDLCITGKDKDDQFAMVIIGCLGKVGAGKKSDFSVFILDYYAGHLRFVRQTKKILELHSQWDPVLTGIETVAYQEAQLDTVEELRPMGNFVGIKTAKDKLTRAWKLSPLFEAERVSFKKGLHGPMIDQLVQFPNYRYKDLFDALDLAIAAAKRRPRKKNKRREPRLM